jgi:hypothetical protein
MPKMTRTTRRKPMLYAAAVRPQKIDHTVIATRKTRFGPKRSEAQPPTKQNRA